MAARAVLARKAVAETLIAALGVSLWAGAHSRDASTLLASWAVLVGLVALLAWLHVLGFVSAVALFGSVAYFSTRD